MGTQIFSAKVEVCAGEPLGGHDPTRFSLNSSDELEVNGLSFTAQDGLSYRLCSVDCLYAGHLVEGFKSSEYIHLFAASHTHCAPMIDSGKPKIGGFSFGGYEEYAHAISRAEQTRVEPRRFRVYQEQLDVPVYRRFDYPDTILNRLLTSRFGLYPNDEKSIDRSIYLFEFGGERHTDFVLVYHACHPVSRGVDCELSSDYVGAVREAVRERFSCKTVVFLQGCSGDIRPNMAKKRIRWLPRCRLNWRFDGSPGPQHVAQVDNEYATAVWRAKKCNDIVLDECSFDASVRQASLTDGRTIDIWKIQLPGDIELHFFPFEMSHLYHLDWNCGSDGKFIVSCANNTLGYLSHPSQHSAGGYEVDGSLSYMGQREKLQLKEMLWLE